MKVPITYSVVFFSLSCALVLCWGRVYGSSSDLTVLSIPSSDFTVFNRTSSDTSGSDATSIDSTGGTSTSSDSTAFNTTSSDSTGSGSTSSDSTASCIADLIADGNCDISQNIEACGYDGGDCCECTCVSTEDSLCGETSDFACVDPNASCVDGNDDLTSSLEGDYLPTSDYTSTFSCFTGYISDGYCDLGNNNEDCGYDGGDCCECTCISTEWFTCGDGSKGGYACLDPNASCVNDDDITTIPDYGTYSDPEYTGADSCATGWFSDGFCDYGNNNEECGYDGGDCCECTCKSTTAYTCGENDFACVDPSASCVDDDDVTSLPDDDSSTTSSNCVVAYYADGDCDPSNNSEECNYDEGDCCECTCVSTDSFTCGDDSHGGYECQDPSAPCLDDDSTSTTPYSDSEFTSTNECAAGWFSDGLCDDINNKDECGYDGGDCCECTCTSTTIFTCGDNDFNCIDPDASCVDDDIVSLPSSGSPTSCNSEYFADGDCDPSNNNENCDYDEGDCCECTCVSTDSFTCGDESHGGYACIDPSAACVDDDDVTTNPGDYSSTTVSGCIPAFKSDGDCDQTNNNEDCDYDGGDCCECTCIDTDSFTCGDESHGGFTCLDPRAPCVDDDDATAVPSYESYTNPEYTTANSCATGWFSDGLCDPVNNNEACGYDGGDCCECTCESGKLFTCGDGGYGCIDPRASCVDDDDYIVVTDDESLGYTTTYFCETGYISDGDCDPINNKADCGYDGGDCCACTCESTVDYTCGDPDTGGYACIDPSADCVDDDDVESTTYTDPEYTEEFACNNGWLSDGLCDSINNKEDCGFDGGDCCECTCVSGTVFDCGFGGYACLDPSAPCVDDDDVTTLLDDSNQETTLGCIPGYVSDGDCDESNNNEVCGYDGGDCCECSCVSTEDYICGDDANGGFDCLDPSSLSCLDDDSRFHPTDDFPDDSGDDIIFLSSDDPSETNEDDVIFLPSDDNAYVADASISCSGDGIADGSCSPDNNNEECGYDGGDCCECDCVSTEEYTCGNSGDYDCIDPSSACVNGYVEAGTKTTVGVSANAYDTRPGADSGGAGCQDDGCTPALSRDGISTGTESRWGCAQKLVPDGEACEIEFTFEDPQDIMDVQVAFYKGEERSRTLQAAINSEVIGNFDSYTGSTFNALGIEAVEVHNFTFTTVGLTENEWISFVEVRFLVEP